ncbi:DotU family type VI secretion system protein [soil metagenome]
MSAASSFLPRLGWGAARASHSSAFRPRQAVSLPDIYTDAIYLALDIQRGSRIENPPHFRAQLLHQLDASGGAALGAGYTPEDVSEARYAVASYIDEVVLTSANPLREHWQGHPLQLELYNDNRAGEGFFTRLDALRQAPERNYRLLELYNLCLMLGFEGRYRLEGRETLHSIAAGVAQEIARLRGGKATQLAPHALLRERRRAFHWRVSVWWWPLLALVAAVLGYCWLDDELTQRTASLSHHATVLATTPVGLQPDMQSTLDALLKGKTIAFESGRDVLTRQGAAFLDTLVPVLQGEPAARVAVDGHTDGVGDAASNQKLSVARARAVVAYLVGHGIAAARLEARGFGAERPVADNATREGQAQNRRIEFQVLP